MALIETIGQIGDAHVRSATLTGSDHLKVKLLSYGARLAGLWAPDRTGLMADIVLGHDNLRDWQSQGGYAGATCGRYANRIAGGRFMLDGHEIVLDQNEGGHHLHGGAAGFDSRIWDIDRHDDTQVSFVLTSPAGDMGYPGTLVTRVTYRIEGARLWIDMEAQTDAPTVVNMANHAYFNLAGHAAGDVLGQQLRIDADFYTPVDDTLIPTGSILPVHGTPFDFGTPRLIGSPMPGPSGFDQNLCLSAPLEADGLRFCLSAVDPMSGRAFVLRTTEPGLQLYTGGHFDDTPGKAGARYPRFAGFAVETQRFPDSPNNPQFPSTRLDPGQTYRHRMQFDFTPA